MNQLGWGVGCIHTHSIPVHKIDMLTLAFSTDCSWNTGHHEWLPSLWQPFPLIHVAYQHFGQNASHLELYSPQWRTLSRWFSSCPSSPVQSQPSVHKMWSWRMVRPKLLLGKSSNLFFLHVGQGLCSAWSRSLHVWQKLVPQQSVKYGSRSVRLHIGQSVWKALGGGSINVQSYPPNVSSCCGLPWGSAPPSAPRGVLVGGVFFCWASSASCVCTYSTTIS